MEHWRKILGNEAITKKTILVGGDIAGNACSFEIEGRPEVSYWVWREHWGRGVATAALARLLIELDERPLYARVAKDNVGSRRVLEKCGFARVGTDRGFAAARGADIDEIVMRLNP